MEIIFFTKLLSDLTLYFAATGFIMRFVSTTAYNEGLVASRSGSVLLQFLLLIVIGMGGYALRNKRALRFLPLILLIPVFILSNNIIDSMWVAFPCLLVTVNTIKKQYGCDRKRFMRMWKWYMGIAAACIFLYLFIPYTDGGTGENGAPIFFMLYAASSVLLMRCLRQSDDVLEDKRFRITSIAALLLMLILSVGLSFTASLLHLDTAHIAAFLYKLGYALDHGFQAIKFEIRENGCAGSSILFVNSDYRVGQDPPLHGMDHAAVNGMPVGILIFILIAALAIFVTAFIILFKRKNIRRIEKVNDSGSDRDDTAKAHKSRSIGHEETLSNRNTVRRVYRKFLHALKKKNIDINDYDTTLDIMNSARDDFDGAALDALRKVYAVSRYDGVSPVSDEDVRTAKRAYAKIKRGNT